jgi:LuxR family maltose regulon positive regulatory protein
VRLAAAEGTAVSEASRSDADEKKSQAVLEALDAANLFIVPLDNERRWYRYHHLFADLLRQRLHQNPPPLTPFRGRFLAGLKNAARQVSCYNRLVAKPSI